MASAARAIGGSFPATWLCPAALALGILALPACNSSATADDSGVPADADFVTCTNETRAPMFQPGMQVTSHDGTFVLKVVKNTYVDGAGKVLMVAPTKGNDDWTVETDAAASSGPVDGLTIDVTPFMPDHGHGTSIVAGVTPQGSGTYLVSPLNFFMAGYWEVTFDLTDSSGTTPVTDTAVVKICVPD